MLDSDYVLELLQENGFVTKEQVDEGWKKVADSDGELDILDALKSLRYVDEQEIINMLAQQYGLETIDLSAFVIPDEVIAELPAETARQYQVVPVMLHDDILTVAMSDPTDMETVDTLRYLLTSAGIDPDKDVTITFLSEASEAAARIAAAGDEEIIAMLPQPYVTTVQMKMPELRVALDVTAEWNKLNESTVVTGVIVANTAWLNANREAFNVFLDEYRASTAFAVESVDAAADLVEHFDIFKAAVAKKAIPQCNIVCYTGDDMKKAVSAYLQILFDANPKAVGGAMPGEDFYFVG